MSGYLPWMKRYRVTVPGGGRVTAVRVPAPYRGILSRLVVRQSTGTPGAFTVAGFTDSNAASPGGGDSLEEEEESTGLPDDVFRFTPDLAGTGGAYSDYGLNYGYESNEFA